MTDTPEFIIDKQIEIYLSKPESERWRIGLGLIDAVYYSIKNQIIAENPHFTNGEVMAALFNRYYVNEFAPAELEKITQSILNYHQGK